ncbi:rhodanese-like domain-containing protein [Gemella sp. GH3]|uniref:rhodanese-like domain-containing protein n=1 Tax=unclassified Gemella TaxID=2624949 RepID=UPI0015D06AD0|nr:MULTISPECIES: rhodanese-like domain-containing protein [unclassified Gemella]MBF0714233.1 rhodanese-like domain-containing protein [Gemella sp. GH3.1]NYS51185.1 rhodanese-like domain-containing protein [Gemella sp. GH3]
MKYIIIIIVILVVISYLFWLKLKKGKPGRISGYEVERKTYDEALVVDVRWNKEYANAHAINAVNIPIKVLRDGSDILDSYKDKDIILYCVVDITSRNTEKILREKGFKNLYIGDGIRQYNYGKPKFKNVIMAEFKYLKSTTNHILLNVGNEKLESIEIKSNIDNVVSDTSSISDEQLILVYSDNPSDSLEVSKILSDLGKKVINLIEPMDIKKYTFTPINKKDFSPVPIEDQISECG